VPEIIWIKDATGASVAIAADQITDLNGVATDGGFAQRVKAGWGGDGAFNDITHSTPLPTANPDVISALAAFDTSESHGNGHLTLDGTPQALSEVTLTAGGTGVPANATKALLRADVPWHFNDRGVDATTNDYPIDADTEWVYDGDALEDLNVLAAGAGNLSVWFYA
jgi:hypothetical protein